MDLHLSSLAVLTLLLLGAPEINPSSCEEETRLIWEGITRGSSLQREGLEPLTQACSRLSLSAAKPKLLSPGSTENSAKEQSSDFSLCLQPGERASASQRNPSTARQEPISCSSSQQSQQQPGHCPRDFQHLSTSPSTVLMLFSSSLEPPPSTSSAPAQP